VKDKKYTKYIGKEKDFQVTVANYLRSISALFNHSPNEGKMNPQYGKLRKLQGVSSGVPDVMVYDKVGSYNGLAIELKVGYNKPSETQIEWLNGLEANGWYCLWSNSLDEVIDIIDAYFSNRLKR
jgi:hypothetical protein